MKRASRDIVAALAGRSTRRRLLAALAQPGLGQLVGATGVTRAQASETATANPNFGVVQPGHPLVFPRDHGAHPAFRTEWWYVTGWLDGRAGEAPQGVQITFFRSRTGHSPANPSRFAPHQLLFAHAAVARPAVARLLHDQRAARTGFDWAEASLTDTDVRIGDWRLVREADDRYRTRIAAADFDLDLVFTPSQRPVLQGDAGYSRKGPLPAQASHYYSRPQMQISGHLNLHPRVGEVASAAGSAGTAEGRSAGKAITPGSAVGAGQAVSGRAWLDHEWSTEVLDPRASGWDWCGLNFDDGSALMAFAIRDRQQQSLWSHARFIDAAGQAQAAGLEARFSATRWWRSLRTGIAYPVAMRLTVAGRQFDLAPLFEDQELDSRASTGAIYWEGAVTVSEAGRSIGRGYLELTGYGSRLAI